MSNIDRLGVIWLCALIVGCVGCRAKEPVAPPAPKTSEGPLLAPPQQRTEPAMPQGNHAALPTEGNPAGKSATNVAAAAPAETTKAAKPTEGDPTASANSDGATKPADSETAVAATIKANLASLSTADRALAEKQKICPVSGEPLGAMGPPKKINVAGREIFICCPSCKEAVTDEPAKYLAKIGLQPASKQ